MKDSKLKIIGNYAFTFSSITSITIPSTVIRICHGAFIYCDQLHEAIIPSDSKLQAVEKEAITCTSFESFRIPSKLIELKEKWCSQTKCLNHIEVNSDNPLFCLLDDKIVLGKSSIGQPIYDQIVFCVRDIKTITIPSFIKYICPCAFENCDKLTKIEFQSNSMLQIIGERAFSTSVIKSWVIPSNVTQINNNVFRYCSRLNKVVIPNDLNIKEISSYAFANNIINSLVIPSEVTHINEYAFSYCDNLQIIEIQENSKNKIHRRVNLYRDS